MIPVVSNIKNLLVGAFALLLGFFAFRSNTKRAKSAEEKTAELASINRANAEAIARDNAARRELQDKQRELDKIKPAIPGDAADKRSFTFGGE
jgi:hypothetical protein